MARGDPEFVFQTLDDINVDERGEYGFGEVVAAFVAGGDLSLKPHLLQALQSTIEAQQEVTFDCTTLDMCAAAISNAVAAGRQRELQEHPKIRGLAVLLYGLCSARTTVALAAARVYVEILRAHGANASVVLNSFFLRSILSMVSQLLQSYGKEGAPAEEPQEADQMCSQQSIVLTQNIPASQVAMIPASQRPAKRRRVPPRRGNGEAPDDTEEVYDAIHELVAVFQDGTLLGSIRDHALVVAVVEALCAYPTTELAGPFAGLTPLDRVSKVAEICHSALQKALERADEFEILHVPEVHELEGAEQGTADGASDDGQRQPKPEESGGQPGPEVTVTKVTMQHIILPHLLPIMHLTPAYVHCVRLGTVRALQNATVALLQRSGIEQEALLLFLKLFVVSGERRPRSEEMSASCRAAVSLAALLNAGGMARFVEHVGSVLVSERVYQRLFAIETVNAMLKDEQCVAMLGTTVAQEMIGLLFRGVNDVASAVRTKALSNLGTVLWEIGKHDHPLRPVMQEFFIAADRTRLPPELAPVPAPTAAVAANPETPARASSRESCVAGPATLVASQKNFIVASVLARTREEKALVRKAAVDLLHQFMVLALVDVGPTVGTVLDLMDQRIEPSVLVRRQAVLCAWEITLHFDDIRLRYKMVAEGILANYSLENEDYVLVTMVKALHAIVFKPLEKHYTEETRENLSVQAVWDLLSRMTDSQLRVLGRVCCQLLDPTTSGGPEIGPGILQSLLSRIDSAPAASRDAWAILPVVARGKLMKSKVDTAVVMKCFRELQCELGSTRFEHHSVLQNVLTLLSELTLSDDDRAEVVRVIEQRILSLRPHANLVDACVRCYATLAKPSSVHNMSRMFADLCTVMFYNLLSRGRDKHLPQSVVDAGLRSVGMNELPIATCTLGSLALTEAGKLDCEQTLLRLSQMVEAVCNVGAVEDASPDEPAPPFDPDMMPLVVQHAFLCEAKLCQLSKAVCKKGVPLLLRGLRSTLSPVKTICLNGLADLSVRFPGTVDKYLANMAGAMTDAEPKVRLTALTLITQLVAESFVKPRPFLIFELIAAIADKEEAIAAFARYALLKVLVPRDPLVLPNSIAEAVFVFNNYRHHPRFNKNATRITKLAGDSLRRTRIELFRFIITQVKSEQSTLRIHAQLHDVLDMCTLEGKDGVVLSLSCPEGVAVLKDVLRLLQTPEMNLTSRTLLTSEKKSGAEDEEEEEAQAAMRKQLWQAAVRLRVRDHVGPILCSVNQHLRELRSPLQRELIHYAAYATQEYEADLSSIFEDELLLRDVKSYLEDARKERGNKRSGQLVAAEGTPSPGRRRSCSRRHSLGRACSRRASVARSDLGAESTPKRNTRDGAQTDRTPGSVPVPLLQTPTNLPCGRSARSASKRPSMAPTPPEVSAS